MRCVSFVLASRDEDPSVLHHTLQGLLRTTCAVAREILVVDDGSRSRVHVALPEVTVLRNDRPTGGGPARRRGCAEAAGDVLCIMDSHLTFSDGWLETMLEFVDSGALLCTPWSNYDRSQIQAYGSDFGWNQDPPKFLAVPRRKRPGRRQVKVPMICGACYMMRRDSYEQIGGFNPFLRNWGFEDDDLSIRAWLLGAGVRCVRDALVGHRDRLGAPNWPAPREGLVFNLLVLIRTLFEAATGDVFEEFIQPIPPIVESWLEEIDLDPWRDAIQARRQIDDAAFFTRFGQRWPLCLRGRPRVRRGFTPASQVHLEERQVGEPSRAAAGPTPNSRELLFSNCGLDLKIEVSGPSLWPVCLPALPVPRRPAGEPVTTFSVVDEGSFLSICRDGRPVARVDAVGRVAETLQECLEWEYLVAAKGRLFIPGCGVVVDGQALLLPGRPSTGVRALTWELARQGAAPCAIPYAAVDSEGGIHSYSTARAAGNLEVIPVESLPVRLVAFTVFRPGARWCLKPMSPGWGIKALLELSGAGARKAEAIRLLSGLAGTATFVSVRRGDCRSAARRLAEWLRSGR